MYIHPCSIRVWVGFSNHYMQENYSRFLKVLGDTFMPATLQMMHSIGLHSYLPAIVPPDYEGLPDEIALVGYETRNTYRWAAKNTAMGRAYGKLHGSVFSYEKSKSQFPELWQEGWEFNRAYFLIDKLADWKRGKTQLLVATHVKCDTEELKKRISDCINKTYMSGIRAIDGCIFYTNKDYFLCWEHCQELRNNDNSFISNFKKIVENVVIDKSAKNLKVNLEDKYYMQEAFVKPGDFLNILINSGLQKDKVENLYAPKSKLQYNIE